MSIVIKKIHNRDYAYLAYRRGKRVVQKYLGKANDPKVAHLIEQQAFEIPSKF